MSANTSQRKLQTLGPRSDVADFAAWRLVITCRGGCVCRTRLSDCDGCPASAVLVSRLPAGVTVLRQVRQPGGAAKRVGLHQPRRSRRCGPVLFGFYRTTEPPSDGSKRHPTGSAADFRPVRFRSRTLANPLNGGGGAERDRTADLLIANEALSQLSYSPAVPGGGT